MPHRLVAVIATAAAVAAAAVLATSGSAQTQPTTLHFVSTPERSASFFPKRAPHPGDRLGFGSKVSGDDTGYSRAICTVLGKKGEGDLPCTMWVHLSHGTLALQGPAARAGARHSNGRHRRDRRLQRSARNRPRNRPQQDEDEHRDRAALSVAGRRDR